MGFKEELKPAEKLYDLIDKVVIVTGAIPSDPSRWEFYINGHVLKVDTDSLESMKSFRQQYLKTFHRPAPKIIGNEWTNLLDALAEEKAEIIQEKEESGPVFIAREIFELVCSREISEDIDEAVSGLTLYKYQYEDDDGKIQDFCCMPSSVLKGIVDGSGFKIPLNELSSKMVELKMKAPGTTAVRYGKGRKLRSWWFHYEAVLEKQREGDFC